MGKFSKGNIVRLISDPSVEGAVIDIIDLTMRYNSIEEFKSQYNGQWSPIDNHWFGLDFMHNGKSYRFNTWSDGNRNMDCLPDGRKIKFIVIDSFLSDYSFSEEQIESYKIDLSKLHNSRFSLKYYYSSFQEIYAQFSRDKRDITYTKKYNPQNGMFEIKICGVTSYLNEPREEEYRFDYFFEFAKFLNGDLSEADLVFCPELINIKNADVSWINFNKAKLTSDVRISIGIEYENFNLNIEQLQNDELQPEERYSIINNYHYDLKKMEFERNSLFLQDFYSDRNSVFYYFSDLHLADRFTILYNNNKLKCQEDEIYLMKEIVYDIINPIKKEYYSKIPLACASVFLLISGDTSRDIRLFKLLVDSLRKIIDSENLCINVIFTLGNRELYRNNSDYIIEYRNIIEDSGMYLLQNEILFLDKYSYPRIIPQNDLLSMIDDPNYFRDYFKTSRIIIFGGLGFNIDNPFYPSIDGDIFEKIYEKICECLYDKHVIIQTHYPPILDSKNNLQNQYYCEYRKLQPGFIYVHGHTHNNYYYNDDKMIIYADNQLYANEKSGFCAPIGIKKFYIENSYDLFKDYTDGIYEISLEDYKSFYRGININMSLNHDVGTIYMVKKNNYYCFVCKKQGIYSIMKGGQTKTIGELYDIQYIYDNMDTVINFIKEPLDKFNELLQYVSNYVKMIGGNGTIHGCIVDIDYWNHIYVNPHDQTITPYFANSIVDKTVFPNISMLLETNCKSLYDNMKKLFFDSSSENGNDMVVIKHFFINNRGCHSPQPYESTDIYSLSNIIKAFQRLNYNVLTKWYSPYDIRNKKNKFKETDIITLINENNTLL